MKPLNKVEKYAVAHVVRNNHEPDSIEWRSYLENDIDRRLYELRCLVRVILNYEIIE